MDGPLEPRTLGAGDCVQFELIAIARADLVVLVDALYTYLLPAPAKKKQLRSRLAAIDCCDLPCLGVLFRTVESKSIAGSQCNWNYEAPTCSCTHLQRRFADLVSDLLAPALFIDLRFSHLHDLHFPLFTFDYFHVLFTLDYSRFSTTKWFHFHFNHTIYVNHQLTFLPRYLITNLGQPERQARSVGTLFQFQSGKRHHRR